MNAGEQRHLEYNSLGRKIITREKVSNKTGFVHVFYCSRALEWINMKKFFSEIFMFLSIPQFIPALFNIMFAWTYHPNVSMLCQSKVML
jgi:hypothetical protein